MKLSSKTITAIKLFIDLAEQYENGFITLNEISQRKDISKKFLEQIVPIYKTSGLLLVNRGNQGGYKLSKDPKDISLLEICKYTENSFEKVDYDNPIINQVINGLDSSIIQYLENISLKDICDKQKDSYSNNYVI